MITYRAHTGDALEEVPAHKEGGWIDVVGMTPEEALALSQAHGLDEGHLADAQDFFEVPRVEREGDALYYFSRYPVMHDGDTTTAPILVVVGPTYVLTAVHDRPEWLTRFAQRAHVAPDHRTRFLLQLLSAVEREYTKTFNAIRKDVRRARLSVRDVNERTIESLVNLEYATNELLGALVPSNAALVSVVQGKYVPLPEEDMELLEDVQLANAQLIESGKSALKTMQNIRSAHAALVSNRLNNVVRTLAALTVLFTVPTGVGALYGMNVALPLQNHEHAFLFIILCTAVLTAVLWWFFHRRQWL